MMSALQEKFAEKGLVKLIAGFEGSELDFKIILDRITPDWLKPDNYDLQKMNIEVDMSKFESFGKHMQLGSQDIRFKLYPMEGERINRFTTEPTGWHFEVWKVNDGWDQENDEEEADEIWFALNGDLTVLHKMTAWLFSPQFCSLCTTGIHPDGTHKVRAGVCYSCSQYISLHPCKFCKRKIGEVFKRSEIYHHKKCWDLHQ